MPSDKTPLRDERGDEAPDEVSSEVRHEMIVAEFERHLRLERDLSPHTIRAYVSDVTSLLAFVQTTDTTHDEPHVGDDPGTAELRGSKVGPGLRTAADAPDCGSTTAGGQPAHVCPDGTLATQALSEGSRSDRRGTDHGLSDLPHEDRMPSEPPHTDRMPSESPHTDHTLSAHRCTDRTPSEAPREDGTPSEPRRLARPLSEPPGTERAFSDLPRPGHARSDLPHPDGTRSDPPCPGHTFSDPPPTDRTDSGVPQAGQTLSDSGPPQAGRTLADAPSAGHTPSNGSGDDAAFAQLDIAMLREWLAGQHAEGMSRATLARRTACARTFTAYCHRRGWLAHDPGLLLGSAKAGRPLPRSSTGHRLRQRWKSPPAMTPRTCATRQCWNSCTRQGYASASSALWTSTMSTGSVT